MVGTLTRLNSDPGTSVPAASRPVWDKPGEFAAYVKTFAERGTAVLKDLGLAKN